MKFTAKCKYGLQALLEIAFQHKLGNSLIKRKAIAEKQQIPKAYLENILILLKNHGIIKSTRGTNGGYFLIKKPSEISLYEVINILEGKSQIEECINSQGECKYKDKCKIKLIWEQINEYQKNILQNISLDDLLNKENECIPCFKVKIDKINKGVVL